MRRISKRNLLVLTTVILLFCGSGYWLFGQWADSTSIYPNASLIETSSQYSEIGLIKLNQFRISSFATNDSYQEVLLWFMENDWNIFLAAHEEWYRLNKEETVWGFYPEIRRVFFIDIQPSTNNQTCITQVSYASVLLFDGEIIHRSQDYLEVGSDYYHYQPECSIDLSP